MSTHFTLPVRKTLLVLAAGTLVFTACGGDDDTGDGTPRGELAAKMKDGLEVMGGITADADCIETEAASLSDADVDAMIASLDSGDDAPANLSDWNTTIGEKCISIDE